MSRDMFRRWYSLICGVMLLILVLMLSVPDTSAQAPTLYINEVMVGNASTTLDTDYYNYSSWIEVYNSGSTAVNLKDYSFVYQEYELATPFVWTIPSDLTVPANGTALVWADEQGTSNHATFEFDMRGDTIELRDPGNALVDTVSYDMRDGSALLADISYGRQTDGATTWVYFDQPTAGASNTTTGFAAPTLAAMPAFSVPGGFYTGNQTVSLSTTESGGVIRYTTDGSIPTLASDEYVTPLTISTPTAVRARVFTPNKLDSPTATHTYLIGVGRNLPVVSLATKAAHLFDDTIGIYVVGTNGIIGNCSTVPVNWNQKWERPASIEMYEVNGSRVVAQDVGIEIHGGCSRRKDLKSLEIKARRTYGDNDIDYRVLPDKPIDSYKRLVLRNSGNDSGETLFRDALQHYLVKDTMDVDWQAYRPAVVFINGAYWGIHNIRDKADESFVEQNYGLDADFDFDMIEKKGLVEAGSVDIWNQLYTFVTNNDLTVPANYAYVKSQVDLVEYANYFIAEIYGNNQDWPGNNIRYWRAYDNGHWRWVMYDLDAGFGINNVAKDYFSYIVVCSTCTTSHLYQTALLRKLMQNTEFRDDFVQRFASHINITYDPARVSGLVDEFEARIAPEMPTHIARWGLPTTMFSWHKQVNNFRSFGTGRPANMIGFINSYLGSPGTANLTVNINGGGKVLAAGVQVPGSGYTGPYFKTVPMTLEAVPQAGWKFARWQETGETEPQVSVTLTGNLTRTAVFEVEALPVIVINEIHYNPVQGDTYEFIELLNAGTKAVNLAGFSTVGVTYAFPAGSSIAAGEVILLTSTSSTYAGNGYQVFQWDSGSVSNGGEQIALLDKNGNTIDDVTYDDAAPWPISPDGGGPSLALIDPALDNSLAESWAASPVNGGSPGAANPSGPPLPASLTIVKEVVGAVPAADWQFTGGLGNFSLAAAGESQTFSDLATGPTTVTETAVTGYSAAVSCTNGASGSSSVTVNLGSGANVTCTFVNTKIEPASLTIVKQVVGAVPAADWQFTGDLGPFSLAAAGESQTFSDLATGPYTVTETTVSNYTAEVSCTNGAVGSSSVTVNLASGANVTCTFVNTKTEPATLTITKQVVGAVPPADWQFTGALGAFSLAAAGESRTFSNLAAGPYKVTETAVNGYTASVSCSSGPSGTSSVTVDLVAGDNVTCTFVNTESTSTVPPQGHCSPPVAGNLILNPGFESNKANWQFYANSATTFTVVSKPAAGVDPYECSKNARVETTTQGTNVQLYQTGFLLKPNTTYSLRLAGRSSAGQDAALYVQRHSSPYNSFGLNGAVLNLTAQWQVFQVEFKTTGFTTQTSDTRLRIWLAPYDQNGSSYEFDDIVLTEGTAVPPEPPQPASLTIVKQVVGTVPAADWQFTGDLGSFSLAAAGESRTFSNLTASSYTVRETAVTGYTTQVSCTSGAVGSSSVTVNLASGANVTCTFVNTEAEPATLTITKQVVGAVPAADWQFTGALGAFSLAAAGESRTFSNLAAGPYKVTETAVNGYTASVSCSSGPSGTSSVTVDLAAGDNVTCTFVNTESTSTVPPQGHCSPPVAGNLILNPGFESNKANWQFYANSATTFTVVSKPAAGVDPYECSKNARVETTTQGTNVQLYQTGFLLKPNTTYSLRLAARSSAGQDASLYVQRHSSPYNNYGLNGTVLNLTAQWQVFQVEFKTSGFTSQTTDTRLRIWLAPYDQSGSSYEFDDIVLTEK